VCDKAVLKCMSGVLLVIQTGFRFIVGQKMRIGWLVSVQLQVIIEKNYRIFRPITSI